MVHALPFREYLKTTTQQSVAAQLGVTQAAVSKMARSNREIFASEKGGKLYVYEIRPIGNNKAA